MNSDTKEVDMIFLGYMAFLCLCVFLSFLGGQLHESGKKIGFEEGVLAGQVDAMNGKWHYAPQIVLTTNWIQTNYVKVVDGIPEPLKFDIRPVGYKPEVPNFFNLTNAIVPDMVIPIEDWKMEEKPKENR